MAFSFLKSVYYIIVFKGLIYSCLFLSGNFCFKEILKINLVCICNYLYICGINYIYMVKTKVKKSTDHNGKEIKIPNGKNIRFTDAGHKMVSDYCKEMGFNLGKFCERAAISEMSVIKSR